MTTSTRRTSCRRACSRVRVGAWLGAIAVNLFTKRSHYDVAVRDLVMGIGAITLAKLTEARSADQEKISTTDDNAAFRAPDQGRTLAQEASPVAH